MNKRVKEARAKRALLQSYKGRIDREIIYCGYTASEQRRQKRLRKLRRRVLHGKSCALPRYDRQREDLRQLDLYAGLSVLADDNLREFRERISGMWQPLLDESTEKLARLERTIGFSQSDENPYKSEIPGGTLRFYQGECPTNASDPVDPTKLLLEMPLEWPSREH